MNEKITLIVDAVIEKNAVFMDQMYKNLLRNFSISFFEAALNENMTEEKAMHLINSLDSKEKLRYFIDEYSPAYPQFSEYLKQISSLSHITIQPMKIIIMQFFKDFVREMEQLIK